MVNNVPTSKVFSERVEDIVCKDKIPYMDAILHCCDELDIEVESGAKLINNIIKQKIRLEASELNQLKEKINKLPV